MISCILLLSFPIVGSTIVSKIPTEEVSSKVDSRRLTSSNCCQYGDPQQLFFKYTGSSCAATANTQSSSKTSCTDYGSSYTSPVFIRSSKKSDACSEDTIWFDGLISTNEVLVLNTKFEDRTNFEDDTYVHIIESESTCNTDVIQTNLIHTSCSEPLVTGDIYGSLELVDCSWDDFTPAPTGIDCCLNGEDPMQITFTYTGEGCYASLTTQSEDNGYTCEGVGAMFAPYVYIMVTDNSDPCNSNPLIWFEEYVLLNYEFTLSVANEPSQSKFNTDTYIHILNYNKSMSNWCQDGLYETIKFKTGCDKPLYVGQVFGSAALSDCSFVYASPVPTAVYPPSAKPTLSPSNLPTISPTISPTSVPVPYPTFLPTTVPIATPTNPPVPNPTLLPTSVSTTVPTDTPTSMPNAIPTSVPTICPTSTPSSTPSAEPTVGPSTVPTSAPTTIPTRAPTTSPTTAPTAYPTSIPTSMPTIVPTSAPTFAPTATPTLIPTVIPTSEPTLIPTSEPTAVPSNTPSSMPTSSPTSTPTVSPTAVPSSCPTLVPTSVPTSIPTGRPSSGPTATPSAIPTAYPTSVPTSCPTSTPSSTPTSEPTVGPSTVPTSAPTTIPTRAPTASPTTAPTAYPTSIPTSMPTIVPTSAPTFAPTAAPTSMPTVVPTSEPTPSPTSQPTSVPSTAPSSKPTISPTSIPTACPTVVPSSCPTFVPTSMPTSFPTDAPTSGPTATPTSMPTEIPTSVPTFFPTSTPSSTPSAEPTLGPSAVPTSAPTTIPTRAPTASPTTAPTSYPTSIPTSMPTIVPTSAPTFAPTPTPTSIPTAIPSSAPTLSPTGAPTSAPTIAPSSIPTISPTSIPTACPTVVPYSSPTIVPTSVPTKVPTGRPSSSPTTAPSSMPTAFPTSIPTSFPTSTPSSTPTSEPTLAPSAVPTLLPTAIPTRTPTASPTSGSTACPTSMPTSIPTSEPTSEPTLSPSTAPTSIPSVAPSFLPSTMPTSVPTRCPTSLPTARPTEVPTAAPTSTPTSCPSATPTLFPTAAPTSGPTTLPTSTPTSSPTGAPTDCPTSAPTPPPTTFPTNGPTISPTATPTSVPTGAPTSIPTSAPTLMPTKAPTSVPTSSPTEVPTEYPTFIPTAVPTSVPTGKPTSSPTGIPTLLPTAIPTIVPTAKPTTLPTNTPTTRPSGPPTSAPTGIPTTVPTSCPTSSPTAVPSFFPTSVPTSRPTTAPTFLPSKFPSAVPTSYPTAVPTSAPTLTPNLVPSAVPTATPTSTPTIISTATPTFCPTAGPTSTPTALPSVLPTQYPTALPSPEPTVIPSGSPTLCPTAGPSSIPTSQPSLLPTPYPTILPSPEPTSIPSVYPTSCPTPGPTSTPTSQPSVLPTPYPTVLPSTEPTAFPSGFPTSLCQRIVGPPRVNDARFTSLGSDIHLSFNVRTNRGDRGGSIFSCADIVTLSSGNQDEECRFLDDQTLAITLSTASTILPGDLVILKPDTLRSHHDLQCANDNLNSMSNMTIQNALHPVKPIPILEVPDTVGRCTDVVAEASASLGGGGRGFIYEWSYSGLKNESTDAIVFTNKNSTMRIHYAVLTEEFWVNLTVINFLGIRSRTLSKQVKLSDKPVPSVSISGGSIQIFDAWRSLEIIAKVAFSDCSERTSDTALKYSWTATADGVDFVSTSRNPRFFKLPAYSLRPAVQVIAVVNVSDGVLSNAATARISIRRGNVVATIDGVRSSSRAVALDSMVVLDASTSYDQDNVSTSLRYAWTCMFYADASKNAIDCDGLINITNTALLQFKASEVGVFHIEVTALSDLAPARNDSTWTRIAISAYNRSPLAQIISDSPLDAVINPSVRLRLNGEVATPVAGRLSYTWSLEEGDLAERDKTLSAASVNLIEVNAETLILAPYILEAETLTPGASYVFALRAENSFGTALATVNVRCNASPSSGMLEVAPTYGIAMETLFTLNAANWVDEDFPLMYTFHVQVPFDASTRMVLCASTVWNTCRDVMSAGNDQTNGFSIDVTDTYGATSTSDPLLVYVESNSAMQSITFLSNHTLYLLDEAISDSEVDMAFQLLLAGAESANFLDTRRLSAACDGAGACAIAGVAALRGELLSRLDTVIRMQIDDIESRARQAGIFALLTKSAGDLGSSSQTLSLNLALDLASRAARQGFEIDRNRAQTKLAFLQSLANLESLVAVTGKLETALLKSLDNTLDALLLSSVAGQDVESASVNGLSVASTMGAQFRVIKADASSNAEAYFSADFFTSDDYAVTVAELDASVYNGTYEDPLTARAVRIRLTASGEVRRRRQLRTNMNDDMLLTLPQPSEPIVERITSRYNATAVCAANSTKAVIVPCNGTDDVTLQCDGTAAQYLVECRTVSGPACAEYNGTNWISQHLDTVVASSEANVTCRIAMGSASTARDFKSSSNSIVEYYVSSIKLTNNPSKLIKQPLLLCTLGVITTICLAMAVNGILLDRRDVRRISARISPQFTSGLLGTRHQLTLHIIAKASLPKFIVAMRDEQIFSHVIDLIWRNHSILSIFTEYKQYQSRVRRVYLLYIKCLCVMLSQVIALWLTFPTGYCESATRLTDCEKRTTYFYNCDWKAQRAENESKCQLKIPETQRIEAKLLLLIFISFAFSFPIYMSIEAYFIKHACAPIKLPKWAHYFPMTFGILRCFYDFVDAHASSKKQNANISESNDEDDNSTLSGRTDEDNETALVLQQNLDVHHRVGLRLLRSLQINDPPAEYLPLGTSRYYALRAIAPIMKALYLQRAELLALAQSSETDESRRAVQYLIAQLDRKWGFADFDSAGDARNCLIFAKKIYAQLRDNLETAAVWDTYIEELAKSQPLEACALVVHLIRREHLTARERLLLDAELRNENAFSPNVPGQESKNVAPVTLTATLFAQFLCILAAIIPIWFMLLVAAKLDATGTTAGKRTKRIIFIKTIIFTLFNFLLVEPIAMIIMRLGIPAILYHKLAFFEDPMVCFIPYDVIRIFVEPSTLISPVAALTFAQVCDRIPMRLGPHAIQHALEFFNVRRQMGKDFIDDEAYRNYLSDAIVEEFQYEPSPVRRQSLNVPRKDLEKSLLVEASQMYAAFTKRYPGGRNSTRKENKLTSESAHDFYRGLYFFPPKSQLLLVLLLSCFLLVGPARSLLAQEMVIFLSFFLESCILLRDFRHGLEFADRIFNGGSELLFLALCMASLLLMTLLCATLVSRLERGHIEKNARTRQLVRQRLTSTFADESSAKVIPEENCIDFDQDGSRRASVDSLEGFIMASSNSVAAAKGNRRGTLRVSLNVPTLNEYVVDDEKNSEFGPESLSYIDPERCPISSIVFNCICDTDEANEKDESESYSTAPASVRHDKEVTSIEEENSNFDF